MSFEKANDFLAGKYGAENVKYIGAGSDSWAFKVEDKVFRFPKKDTAIYHKEAIVCNAIKKYISIEIPNIKIHDNKGLFFVEHKMLTGERWSWHKFSYKPAKQRRLAKSCASFLAQLHSIDTADLVQAVPDLTEIIPYIDFVDVEQYFAKFLTPRQMKIFKTNYEQIINYRVPESDKVLVHMGLKGPNSVIHKDGRLKGVFDFCNCGIYERGRDLVTFALSNNRKLYKIFLEHYCQETCTAVDKKRIMDLAKIEFLWKKRWLSNGEIRPLGDRFLKSNIVNAMAYFTGTPKFWIKLQMLL